MLRKLIYTGIFILLGFSNLISQESLSQLQINPQLIHKKVNTTNEKRSKSATKSVISLPFIDDFANTIGYPDSSIWIDNYAFTNNTYAINPPSIGVATLDAIDNTGKLYTTTANWPFSADTLTSKIINLDYPGNTSIYLSFFYQPGGLGDTPETQDSLFLEFYSEDTKEWEYVWSATFNESDSVLTEHYFYNSFTDSIYGDTLTNLTREFQQVMIPILEDKFLNDTFQLRFRNYASLSSSSGMEGRSGNSDHWNLDYIVLDQNRDINDTIYQDVAITSSMTSFLKDYKSIPWFHYGALYNQIIKDSISFSYRNLYSIEEPLYIFFEAEDLTNVTGVSEIYTGNPSILPYEHIDFRAFHTYFFPYDPTLDSALFEIKGYLQTNNAPEFSALRWNDTISFYQEFYNYYAFDDGIAENGYGIIGEGSENAMVAMQFNSYRKDTLRGVQIYFNQTLPSQNTKYFKVHVWDDNGGEPGNIIYTLKDQTADYNNLNEFQLISFDDEIIIEGPFYIGWQKQNFSDMLNVGFDVNNVNNEKLFYRIVSDWVNSKFDGTIMLRPMFGKELNLATGFSTNKIKSVDFKIYPNPANDHLNIELNEWDSSDWTYTIYDIHGRERYFNHIEKSVIDISQLQTGIYFIKVIDSNNNSTTKKFIVQH